MGARRIEILGVPFNSAGTTDGVARAPGALRTAGLVEAMRAAGVDAVDRDDLDPDGSGARSIVGYLVGAFRD